MPEKIEQVLVLEKAPKTKEFTDIGFSPVKGLVLRQIFQGHEANINQIAWSPDGVLLASTSKDKTVRIWKVEDDKCIAVFKSHAVEVFCLAWSPDGSQLATAGLGYLVRIWDIKSNDYINSIPESINKIKSIAWSPNGREIALSGSEMVHVWDIKQNKLIMEEKHNSALCTVAWSDDNLQIAYNRDDKNVIIHNFEDGSNKSFSGHASLVHDLTWIPNSKKILSASNDHTIRLLDTNSGNATIFEGHLACVNCVVVSSDGKMMASKSDDNKIIFWDLETFQQIISTNETSSGNWPQKSMSFHPKSSRLASLGQKDSIIRIWDLDNDKIKNNLAETQSVRYTTAKIVLVGDSGVGKTGLGWRLAHGEFREHSSTHGQQFWVVPELGTLRKDGTECEAVLWDLAGQHIYRSIHSIFLDNVDASLILFDPSNRNDQLKGVTFWLEQLKGKKHLPPSILIGARIDRGAPVLPSQEIEKFCTQYEISGGYISTSAKSGDGIDNLIEVIKAQIQWNKMIATVTTTTFRKIKQYILSLKEKTDRDNVLVRPNELRKQLQTSDSNWQFTDEEMLTATKHLQNHGYVTILRSSTGEDHILLVPDLLVSLASSIVIQADKNPRELGAISETGFLKSDYKFQELIDLESSEHQILVDAAILRFLEHSICFRETLGNDTLLIFPDLIKQKRPLEDEFEWMDDVSYVVRGRVENIYASLVVLIGYTSAFTRINQWQNQAQYELGQGGICGFRVVTEREGELELVLYYSTTMPHYGHTLFEGLFESFLYKKDVNVIRYPPVYCKNKHLLQRAAVIKRAREGKKHIFCDECGEKVTLPDFKKTSLDNESHAILRREALAQLRNEYEIHLVHVKGFRRDRIAPRCYFDYVESDAIWAKRLIHDLRDAGIQVLCGMVDLELVDIKLIIDTPNYRNRSKDLTEKTIIDMVDQKKELPIIRLNIRSDKYFDNGHTTSIGDISF